MDKEGTKDREGGRQKDKERDYEGAERTREG